MCRTHPPLHNCEDNAKRSCHGPARYKWGGFILKLSQGHLELALEMKKKERMTIFEYLVLAYTIVLMNDLGLVR